MNKEDLILYAMENNVEVSERWTKEHIAEEILEKGVELPEAVARELARAKEKEARKQQTSAASEEASKVAETVKTAPVLLHRDYWDEEGTRHSKGGTVNVNVETAKSLIKEGKAERADPLPGEES